MKKVFNRETILYGVIIFLAMLGAWMCRFVQDDAFISFRYARFLAEGHGLVWNVGERVEGYTNFLWTVCMAPAFLFKVDVVAWSYGLSLLSFAVVLSVVGVFARGLWETQHSLWLAPLLLATNYSYCCYATGGLETQFCIAWIILSLFFIFKEWWIMAALCSVVAILTRMDAAVIVSGCWIQALVTCIRAKKITFRFCCAVLIGVLLLASCLLVRYQYYGSWVPNTFLIKTNGANTLRGFYYTTLFFVVYGWWLVVCLGIKQVRSLSLSDFRSGLVIGIGLWCLYIIGVGGDFMEFRLMLPVLPLLVVLVANGATPKWIKGWLIVFSFLYGVVQPRLPLLDRVSDLAQQYMEWHALSEEINTLLGQSRQNIKIGVTGAGIVPFYTEMPALDLLGLTDRDVALDGDPIQPYSFMGNRPGHVRMATWKMVCDKKVNVLIGFPWVVPADSPVLSWSAHYILSHWLNRQKIVSGSYSFMPRFPDENATIPPVIAWPLRNGRFLLSVYVRSHVDVDAAIKKCHARVIFP